MHGFFQALMSAPTDGSDLSSCVQFEKCLLIVELNVCHPGGFLRSRRHIVEESHIDAGEISFHCVGGDCLGEIHSSVVTFPFATIAFCIFSWTFFSRMRVFSATSTGFRRRFRFEITAADAPAAAGVVTLSSGNSSLAQDRFEALRLRSFECVLLLTNCFALANFCFRLPQSERGVCLETFRYGAVSDSNY